MLKRVSSIVLTIMMLISMLCTITVASAASAPQLVLTVDDTDGQVERGQTVIVTVAMSASMDMSGILVKVPFDKNLFEASYTAEGLIGEGYVDHNVNDGKLCLVWGHGADVAATDLFRIALKVKADAAFNIYDIEGAIEAMYHGEYVPYVAGTDYVKAADRLPVEVYCEHTEAYTQPTGNPAKADAKHGVYCSKCEEIFADEACTFSVPVEVDKDTCTAEGKTKITCSVCQYVIETKVDEITDHNWSTEWKKDTTPGSVQHYRECLNDGCEAKDYANCGNWGWNNVSTKDGSKHVCPTCNREEACVWQVLVEKTPATCTQDAYTLYPCTKCSGNYKIVETGTATGHSLKPNADGTTHSCEDCDLVKNVPCSFNKTIQNGDCVTDAIKQCACGGRKVTQEATGVHPRNKIVIRYKEPSIGYSGYIKYFCNDCSSEWDNEKLARGKQFNDIDKKDPACWYYKMAVFAKSFKLIGGSDGNFDGDGTLTRGMVVTILGRYLWEDNAVEKMSETEFKALLKELGGESTKFNDLKGGWYDRYAIALSAIGVVKGSYGNFNGEDNVTREELATFFIRFIDYIEPNSTKTYGNSYNLSDMNTVSDWAKATAERAVKTGLIAGSDGKFDPQGTATRAQMATIMERIVRNHSAYPIVDVE